MRTTRTAPLGAPDRAIELSQREGGFPHGRHARQLCFVLLEPAPAPRRGANPRGAGGGPNARDGREKGEGGGRAACNGALRAQSARRGRAESARRGREEGGGGAARGAPARGGGESARRGRNGGAD